MKWVKFLVIPLLLSGLLFTPVVGIGAGACMGYYPGILERIQKCHRVQELLGGNIKIRPMGCSYGFAKTEGAYGRVSWVYPVAGDRGSGSLKFYLERRGTASWMLVNGIIESGDKTLNVVSCRFLNTQKDKKRPQVY